MGELSDKDGKYIINIKGDQFSHKVEILYDDDIIKEKQLCGTIEQAHFFALGFIEGIKNSKTAVLNIMNAMGDFINER